MNCKKCGKKFISYAKYLNHVKENHKYKCVVCHQLFNSKKLRGRHLRKKHKKEFPCSLCTKKFYFVTGLREHFRAKHSGGRLLPKVSQRSSNLPPTTSVPSSSTTVGYIHEIVLYQHPSNKIPPYQLKCKMCGEIFDTHSRFNTHAKSLHGYKFTCPDCSQVFSQKGTRKSHVKKAIKCQFCHRMIRGEAGLVSHCKAKHDHLSIEAIYSELMGIQFPTLQNQNSMQENELNELEATYEEGPGEDNDSFDDTEEENEGSDDNDYTEEENERFSDTEDDASDYSREGNEGSDNDYTEEENEKSDSDERPTIT